MWYKKIILGTLEATSKKQAVILLSSNSCWLVILLFILLSCLYGYTTESSSMNIFNNDIILEQCLKVVAVQLLRCVWLFVIPWTEAHQLPCPSPSPGVYLNSCPLIWWCHPTISSSVPYPLLLSIFPSIKVFSNELMDTSHHLAKVLELQLQHQPLQWIFGVDFL